MLSSLIVSLLYTILTIILILLLHKLLSFQKPTQTAPPLVLPMDESPETAEGKIRLLLLEYPKSEIRIIDCGVSAEVRTILETLCADHPRLSLESFPDID